MAPVLRRRNEILGLAGSEQRLRDAGPARAQTLTLERERSLRGTILTDPRDRHTTYRYHSLLKSTHAPADPSGLVK